MSEGNELSHSLKFNMELGEAFSKSGFFPDVKTAYQGVVKIMAGKELGFTPFQSMGSIFIVNGRLGISSQAMAGLVNRSKQYKYVVKTLTEDNCVIDILKEDSLVGTSTFNKADAAKAGLINKDNYKNYPRNMMFARALSNACRWYCPEVIQGYYSTEELEDIGGELGKPVKTDVVIDIPGQEQNNGNSIASQT